MKRESVILGHLFLASLSLLVSRDIFSAQSTEQVAKAEPSTDQRGNTPLMWASINIGPTKLQTIIEDHPDQAYLNRQNKDGDTALMWAVMERNFNYVKPLIDAGADVNLRNNKGQTALMIAIGYHPEELYSEKARVALNAVEEIITHSDNLNVQDKEGNTALMWAVMERNFNYVKLLINAGADVNLRNNKGETALMIAIDHYPQEVYSEKARIALDALEEIITHSGNLNVQDKEGNTALILWIRNNKGDSQTIEGIVRKLLSKGADLTSANTQGKTALEYAIEKNWPIDRLKILLNYKGARPETTSKALKAVSEGLKTPLGWDPNLADYLRTVEAYLKWHMSGSTTPFKAPPTEAETRAEKLRELFASLNTGAASSAAAAAHIATTRVTSEPVTLSGTTKKGILEAAESDDESRMHELIQERTDLNVKDAIGNTALMKAAAKGYTEVAQALINAGAELNMQNDLGYTALLAAVQAKKSFVADALLKAGANPNIADHLGITPLMLAAQLKLVSLVNKLIQAGASVNTRNDFGGNTALMQAVRPASDYFGGGEDVEKKMVQYLLNAGAEVNAQNEEGDTALMIAVRANLPDVVQLLIDAGANTDLKNKEGKIAVMMMRPASQAGKLLLARLLKDPRTHAEEILATLRNAIEREDAYAVQELIAVIDHAHLTDLITLAEQKAAQEPTWLHQEAQKIVDLLRARTLPKLAVPSAAPSQPGTSAAAAHILALKKLYINKYSHAEKMDEESAAAAAAAVKRVKTPLDSPEPKF